ncbi:MAG: extracellular solute-binding protein [Clostridiales bacterium]|jgi:multiple sugar transport system substrate-binding protein|nr:extracellular solute-binding protein [Clostridiales bacterium]
MKKLVLFIVTAIMLGLMAACNGGAAPEATPAPAAEATPTPAPAPPVTDDEPEGITLQWAVWDIAMVMYYEPLIQAYAEIAPHVTIELVDLGAADFETILQTQLIGGAEYDLIKIRDVPSYAMHVNADLLMPLNNMLAATDIDLANYMGIPEQFMVDGNLFALPFRSDFWVVFYNKDLFDAAGVDYPTNYMTLDAWADIIRDVTHGEGTDIVWGNHFHTWASTTTLFGILTGQHTIADGNYEWLIPIYELVLALEDGNYVPRRTDLAAGGIHHSATWAAQQIAQVNMGTWFIGTALEQDFRWGLAAYPVPGAAYHGNTMGQVTQLAIPRTANHPEEAMAFIAFVAGEQGAEILASVGQFPAFMTDAALDTILAVEGFPQDETTRGAMRPSNIFLEMPMHELAAEINAIRNEAHTEIMDRTMTIQQGIDMMNQRIGAELLGQ